MEYTGISPRKLKNSSEKDLVVEVKKRDYRICLRFDIY